MQSNISSTGPPTGLSACGGQEDEISELVSPTGVGSNLPVFNLSLNCWLHILSKESSLDQHGDSANLPVGLLTFISHHKMDAENVHKSSECLYGQGFFFLFWRGGGVGEFTSLNYNLCLTGASPHCHGLPGGVRPGAGGEPLGSLSSPLPPPGPPPLRHRLLRDESDHH